MITLLQVIEEAESFYSNATMMYVFFNGGSYNELNINSNGADEDDVF